MKTEETHAALQLDPSPYRPSTTTDDRYRCVDELLRYRADTFLLFSPLDDDEYQIPVTWHVSQLTCTEVTVPVTQTIVRPHRHKGIYTYAQSLVTQILTFGQYS